MDNRRRRVSQVPEEAFVLLKQIVSELHEAEPTKDDLPRVRHVFLKLLDELAELMLELEEDSCPPSLRNRVIRARDALNETSLDGSEFAAARGTLRAIVRDWQEFFE